MATRRSPQVRKPRTYTVVDDVMYYTTKAGHELAMDLDFPSALLARAVEGDKDETGQFDAIRETFGENFEAAYAEMGSLERTRIIKTFFIEWQKAAGLPLGEASGSSSS